MKTTQEYFRQLLEKFIYYKIPLPLLDELTIVPVDKTIKFAIYGPKHSVVFYRLWGPGVVDVWFGKDNDDSGGLALQGSLERDSFEHEDEQLRQILKLHRRFLWSGRRKCLSRFSKYRWRRRR